MKRILLFLNLSLLAISLNAKVNLDSLYHCLDMEIDRFPEYVAKHEAEVETLRQQLVNSDDNNKSYELAMALYDRYRAFVNDSAIHYLRVCINLAEKENQRERVGECWALLALRCSNTGMYDEALEMLRHVNTAQLDEHGLGVYYEACNHVYNELAYYTHLDDMREEYAAKARTYEELLLATVPQQSDAAFLRREMRDLTSGVLDKSMETNTQWLATVEKGSHRYALVALYRYLEFNAINDTDNMMYWLVESALSDVRNAVMDQGSLWEMANQLMLQGDVDRAHKYINFTSTCTNRYGSRQRNWQISPLLSDIANRYKARSDRNHKRLMMTLAGISVLALLLMVSLLYVNRQRKRLASAQLKQKLTNEMLAAANEQLSEKNHALSDVNGQLHALNDLLAESNKVKEEYVGRFMRLCSIYIDKMDKFRNRVNKMIKNREYDELYAATRGQDSKNQQLEELYESFDAAFLHLFPNFIEEVNALLKPDKQMELEKNNRMNTGLRILALIRLGINDSSKIAEFLNYSVNTIYNYRARLKNNAAQDRENFENHVKNIGMPK